MIGCYTERCVAPIFAWHTSIWKLATKFQDFEADALMSERAVSYHGHRKAQNESCTAFEVKVTNNNWPEAPHACWLPQCGWTAKLQIYSSLLPPKSDSSCFLLWDLSRMMQILCRKHSRILLPSSNTQRASWTHGGMVHAGRFYPKSSHSRCELHLAVLCRNQWG